MKKIHQAVSVIVTGILLLVAPWPAYGQELFVLRTEAGLEFYQAQELAKGELTAIQGSPWWNRYANLDATESNAGQLSEEDLFARPHAFQSDCGSLLYRGFRISSLGRVIGIEGRFACKPTRPLFQFVEGHEADGFPNLRSKILVLSRP